VGIQLPSTPAFPAAQSARILLPEYVLQHDVECVAVAVDESLVVVAVALETAEEVSEQVPNPAWHPVLQYVDPVPQYPNCEQHVPKVDPAQVYPVLPPQLPSLETDVLVPVLPLTVHVPKLL